MAMMSGLSKIFQRFYQFNMLEVLQIPLIEVEYQDEQIFTLASNEITNLREGNRSLWYFVDGGFGYQINGDGDAWLWQQVMKKESTDSPYS